MASKSIRPTFDEPELVWESVPGTDHYDLYMVDATTGAVVVNDMNISNASAFGQSTFDVINPLTPGHSYDWYIGADATATGTPDFDSAQTFSLQALTAPTPSGPTNGATIPAGTNFDRPTFSWSAVAGANHYYLYVVDSTTNQVAINDAEGSGTSITVTATSLTPGHSFTWYVGAVSTNGAVMDFDSAQSFNLAALAAPTQNGPSGTIGASPASFSWQAVSGAADHYYLYVADNTTGQAVINDSSVSSTLFTPTSALTSGHSYTWYVAAFSTNGMNALAFSSQSFTIDTTGLAAPTQSGPSGATTASAGFDKPTFAWDSVSGVGSYSLVVVDNTTGQAVVNQNVVVPPLENGAFTPTTGLTPGHSFTWYVAGSNGTAGPYSSETFTLAALAAPTAVGPVGGTTIPVGPRYDEPKFRWNAVPDADHYYLYALDDTTGTVAINNANVAGTSFTASTGLTPGHAFTWYVAAVSSNNADMAFDSPQTFSLAALTGAPFQTGPSGTITTTTPDFTWQSVIGADHYYLAVVDNTTSQVVLTNPNATSAGFTPAGGTLTAGHSFTWYVAAVSTNSMNPLVFSSETFTIASSVLAAPTLLGPSGPTGTNFELSWDAVTGADHYYMVIFDNTTQTVAITSPDITGTSVGDLLNLPGHSFTWYLAAVSASGVEGPFSSLTFTVLGTGMPVQTAPSGSISAATGFDKPEFAWNSVLNASAYSLVVVDNTTGAVVINQNISNSTTSFIPMTALTPGHSFTWYVAATGANNVPGPYSSETFTLAALAGPQLAGPSGTYAPGAFSGDEAPLQWGSVAGADHYYLVVIDNTTGQVVIRNTDVTATTLTPTIGFTPGRNYTWYVAAVSANGMNALAFSSATFALSALPAPVPVGPSGTTFSLTPTVTFNWNVVTGADHYLVYLYDDTTGAVPINQQNVGSSTSFLPITSLTFGDTYTWYVASVSANGQDTVYDVGQELTFILDREQ